MAEQSVLDQLNSDIIAHLQANPRTTNKELADRLGIAESTVAQRIRSLEERNILRIIMQRDFKAMGYPLLSFVDIEVSQRSVDAVAADLAKIEQVASVTVAMSNPDIILAVYARDADHLLEIITREIGAVAGIASFESTMALEVIKLVSHLGVLGDLQ